MATSSEPRSFQEKKIENRIAYRMISAAREKKMNEVCYAYYATVSFIFLLQHSIKLWHHHLLSPHIMLMMIIIMIISPFSLFFCKDEVPACLPAKQQQVHFTTKTTTTQRNNNLASFWPSIHLSWFDTCCISNKYSIHLCICLLLFLFFSTTIMQWR